MSMQESLIYPTWKRIFLSAGIVLTSLVLCLGDEKVPGSTATPFRWPGFLGAGATALSSGRVPLVWSPTENIAWTMPLPGYGQSSPVVWGSRVFVTTVEGDNKELLHVVCFDRDSGKQLWDFEQSSSFPQKNSLYISRAAPTPVLDEKGIYAYFESGDVIAISYDGKPLWTKSLTKEYGAPENKFGLCASPVQLDDRIIILIDDPSTSYLIALDKRNGKTLWKTARTNRTSWSSPAIVEIEGEPQIVCSSAGSVDGYAPSSGELLWSYNQVGGNTGTTPIDLGDGRFLISASPGREGENAELARRSNGMMSVSKTATKWNPQFIWTNDKPTPSWASPVISNGFAYWINRVGVVYCLDATTGELIYAERIKQSPWATPISVGNQLYLFGKNGMTTVLAAGQEFKVVAENNLWSEENPPANQLPDLEGETEERKNAAAIFSQPTVYGAAIVEDQILLRTGSQLFCIQK